MQPNESIEVVNRPISQELPARDVTRLAWPARPDRMPRTACPWGYGQEERPAVQPVRCPAALGAAGQ
jgi:hypothetical protein